MSRGRTHGRRCRLTNSKVEVIKCSSNFVASIKIGIKINFDELAHNQYIVRDQLETSINSNVKTSFRGIM